MKKLISFFIASSLLFTSFPYINIHKTRAEILSRSVYTIYGDINNDGIIDSLDVIAMRKKISSDLYDYLIDYNKDEKLDDEDLQLLSNYILGENKIFECYYYDDADEDNICDIFEVVLFNTDPDLSDTDGDTISDYDEIVKTNTNPTKKFSFDSSTSDADYDSDGDKLTNLEEIKYGTNPLIIDTDNDGLSDYDEIYKYNTNPTIFDTDGDKLSDGDEIILQLDPNNKNSNGDLQDNQVTFEQYISSDTECLTNINNNISEFDVSVNMSAAGVAEKSLVTNLSKYSSLLDDELIIGKAIDFDYDENFSIDKLKIQFSLDSSLLADKNLEDYMIFEYFPDTNYLLPVETRYSSDTVYVETNRTGTFCLVDINEFDEKNNKILEFESNNNLMSNLILNYKLGETEVVFLVDVSGCLIEETLTQTRKSIHDFSQALFEHCDDAVVSIIGYYPNGAYGTTKLIKYKNSQNETICTDLEAVDEAISYLSSCTEDKDNSIDAAIYTLEGLIDMDLFSSDCPNKYAFIVTDSTYSFKYKLGYKLVIPNTTKESLQKINKSDVKLNFLFGKEILDQTIAINNLKTVCGKYEFGIYQKSNKGYFADQAYYEVYSDAVISKNSIPIAYTCSISPNVVPKQVERNAFINSIGIRDYSNVPEADENGMINFEDAVIKTGAAKYDANGNLKFDTYYTACENDELTYNGYEQLMKNLRISTKLTLSTTLITPFSSKILYADDDGDGIPNKDDPYPNEPFDERFEIVNDYNYEPSIDFVNRRYKNSQSCYCKYGEQIQLGDEVIKTPSHHGSNLLGFFCALSSMNNDFTLTDELISSIFGIGYTLDFGPHEERKDNNKAMDHAADALMHYFGASGNPMIYSESDTCELLSCSSNNLDHLHNNLTLAMICSESILKDNTKIVFSSKSNSELKATCNVDRGNADDGISCDIMLPSYHVCDNKLQPIHFNYVNRDWFNTVGESGAALVAEVSMKNDTYTMKYRYYFKDIYEWAYHYDETLLSYIFHSYHEKGWAQEYLMSGSFEGNLTWKSGETAFNLNVLEQVQTTLKHWEDETRWEKSNEYDRFISDIKKNGYKKDY